MKIALVGKNGEGLYATIDPEDYDKVSQYPWYLLPKRCKSDNSKYFRVGTVLHSLKEDGTATSKTIYLHRLVMGLPDSSLDVDHVNNDTLDNRKSNLKIETHSQHSIITQRRRKEKKCASSQVTFTFGTETSSPTATALGQP